jgi:hypothetical protein
MLQELQVPLKFYHEFLEGGAFFHLGISGQLDGGAPA